MAIPRGSSPTGTVDATDRRGESTFRTVTSLDSQFVTTGTCVVPPAVAPGDRFKADFGELGSVEVRLT